MNRLKHLLATLAVIVALFLISSQTAYASVDLGAFDHATHPYYIGPGVGTLIAQVLIGLAIGGAAMAGIYRVRVKGFLVNLFSRRRQAEESEEQEEDDEVAGNE